MRSSGLPFFNASARAASFSAFFRAATSLAATSPLAMLKKVLLNLIFGLDLSFAFINLRGTDSNFKHQTSQLWGKAEGKMLKAEVALGFSESAEMLNLAT